MSPRIAFILYDSRSGSTLLASLLNRFAGVEVSLESAFVSRVLEYRGPTDSTGDIVRLVDWLREEVQFRELGIDTESVLRRLSTTGTGPYSRPDVIQSLIQCCFTNEVAEWWVVKHPPYVHAAALCSMFPDVRFIHVVRDGRAVFASKRKSLSVTGSPMQSNLIQAARDWSRKIEVAQALGARAHTVRFEDLVADPEAALASIADFLELSDEGRRAAASHADYARRIGASQKHLHTKVAATPDPGRIEGWSAELHPMDVACYTALARSALTQYGYVKSSDPSANGSVSRVSTGLRMAHWWAHLGLTKVRNVGRRIRRGEGLRALLRPPRARVFSQAKRSAASVSQDAA